MATKRKTTETPAPRKSLGPSRPGARFPAAAPATDLPADYAEALAGIKSRIQEERLRVVLAADAALVLLYWDIGRRILDRQESAGWGAKVVDRLAADLRRAFAEMRGFSPRNRFRVRRPAGPARGRRPGLPARPALLPSQAALLRGYRAQGW